MHEINRKVPPQTFPLENAELLAVQTDYLDNNLPVYTVKGGDQEVLKIDFIFDAGLWFQSDNLMATISNSMLNGGTSTKSAAEIAEWFDFRGAYIQLSVDQNWAYVSILTLNKHANDIIAMAEEMIKDSVFPQDQLDATLLKRRNRFIVENQKVKTICQKKFTQALFGMKHPYALTTTMDDFDQINRHKIYQFYKDHYHANACRIVIAGNPTSEIITSLNNHFGQNDWGKKMVSLKNEPTIEAALNKQQYYEQKDAIQTAIRMGNHTINQTHDDYPELLVVNTILGGYFGSRLMSNLREEKGLTYGIYSILLSLTHGGYFFITTETDAQNYQTTINEVYNELKRLRTAPVSEEELSVVRHYMLGELLRDLDGPFAQAAMIKNLLEFNMDHTFLHKQFAAIRNISSERIMQLAHQYFNEENLIEVAVGAAL